MYGLQVATEHYSSDCKDEELSLPPPRRRFCRSTHTSSYTEIDSAIYSHTWKIKNISSLQAEQNVRSCEFPTSSPEKLKWYLTLGSKYFKSERSQFVIRLDNSSSAQSSVGTNISLSLLNSSGTSVQHHEEFFTFSPSRRSAEVVMECKELDLSNDELIVECSLKCLIPPKTTFFHNVICSSKPEDNVLKHLTTVFRDRKHTDMKIVVEGKHLEVHKVILAACSPVFEAMLENQYKESERGEVHIEDFGVEVVEAMLNFFYTGDVPNMETIAKDLLPLADKYSVENLKALCEYTLASGLDVENVSEILCLGDLHNCSSLKKRCLLYIKMNSSKVLKTKSWDVLKRTKSNLLDDVIKALAD